MNNLRKTIKEIIWFKIYLKVQKQFQEFIINCKKKGFKAKWHICKI